MPSVGYLVHTGVSELVGQYRLLSAQPSAKVQDWPSLVVKRVEGGTTSHTSAVLQRRPSLQTTPATEQSAPAGPAMAHSPHLLPASSVQLSEEHCDGKEQL